MLKLGKTEPGIVVSGALHVAVLAFLLFGLPAASFPDAEEGIPVEVISEDMLGQITRGDPKAKQVAENPKPEAVRVAEVAEQKDNREDERDLPSTAKRPEDMQADDKPEPANNPPPLPPPPPPPPKPDPEPQKPSAEEVEAMLKQQQEAELAEQKRKAAEQEKQRQIAEQKRKEAEQEKQRQIAEQKRKEAEQEKQRQIVEQKRKEAEQQKQRQIAEQKRKDQEAKEAKARSDAQLAKLLDDASSTLNNSREASRSTGSSAREVNRTASLGTATGNAARLSPNVRQQLVGWLNETMMGCWDAPMRVRSDLNPPKPLIRMGFNPDGTLSGEPVALDDDGTELYRIAAESAKRAIRKCSPLQVPDKFKGYYGHWKLVDFRFDVNKTR